MQGPCLSLSAAGKVQDAKLLLELGAFVNTRDQKGGSALFTACFHGHAPMVDTLLAAGADATMQNAAGESPVYIAALRGHFKVVVLLLHHFQQHGIPWQVCREGLLPLPPPPSRPPHPIPLK